MNRLIQALCFILFITSFLLGQSDISQKSNTITGVYGLTYKNSQFNCEISVPNENWKILQYELPLNDIAPDIFIRLLKDKKSEIKKMPWILLQLTKGDEAVVTLIIDYKTEIITLDEYDKGGEKLISEYVPDYKLLSKEYITIDGNNAIKKVVLGTFEGTFSKVQQVTIYTNNFFYILTLGALPEKYKYYESDFDSITSSFKISEFDLTKKTSINHKKFDLIGEWFGTDNFGTKVKLLLDNDGFVSLKIDDQNLYGRNVGGLGSNTYRIDYSKSPIWLDMIQKDNNGNEVGRMLSIVEFINENKIRWRISYESGVRPEKFIPNDNNTIIMTKVINE